MVYYYYDYLKKQQQNEKYNEITDIVKQNIWSESIDFKLSREWSSIEEKILFKLYILLRYT